MEQRQSDSYRCQIVRQFLLTINDETTRLTCFLYMRGFQDSEILRALHLPQQQLRNIKDQLAFDLIKAGIQNTEQPISAQERRSESEPECCLAENVSDSA